MRITDDKLHGRVVLSADGIAIGEISKLFLQGSQFQIEGIEVKLRKEIAERFGLKSGMFSSATIEVPTAMVQSVGDAVLLSGTVDELRSLGALADQDLKEDTRPDSSRELEPDPSAVRT